MSIYEGDEGTVFTVTLYDQDGEPLNLTGATTKAIFFLKPNGTMEPKSAVVVGDPKEGKLSYTAEPAFLDEVGEWRFQAYAVTPAGKWMSTVAAFPVLQTIIT